MREQVQTEYLRGTVVDSGWITLGSGAVGVSMVGGRRGGIGEGRAKQRSEGEEKRAAAQH